MGLPINAEMRRRVERLLSGTYRNEDFTRLFAGFREQFHACNFFREIADFDAHSEERVKGPITRRAQDFFTYLLLAMPMILDRPGFRLSGRDVGRALEAQRRIIGDQEVLEGTGLRPTVASSVIGALAAKIDFTEGRQVTTKTRLTEREDSLFRWLTGRIAARPAFSQAVLLNDFKTVLRRNRVLSEEEEPLLDPISNPLALYAVSRMHGTRVRLAADVYSSLEATPELLSTNKMYVRASIPIVLSEQLISAPILHHGR